MPNVIGLSGSATEGEWREGQGRTVQGSEGWGNTRDAEMGKGQTAVLKEVRGSLPWINSDILISLNFSWSSRSTLSPDQVSFPRQPSPAYTRQGALFLVPLLQKEARAFSSTNYTNSDGDQDQDVEARVVSPSKR